MHTIKNSKRLETPDLLKGFAVIFMIQVHIMELFAKQAIYDDLAGHISLSLGGVPAAPVFMLVMGYFLAYKLKSSRQMIVRGIKLFVAGLLLNFFLNLHLAYKVFFEGWDEFVNIYQYWFGADILHLAGLSMIVIGLVQNVFKTNRILWLIFALLIPALSMVLNPYSGDNTLLKYLMAFIFSKAAWSYFPLIPWLAYPLAGYAFRLIENKYSDTIHNIKWKVITGIILFVIVLVTGSFGTHIMTDLNLYYHHGLLFSLWAIGLSAVWTILLDQFTQLRLNSVIIRYICWLGENVTFVYIIQWLIIGNVATAIFKTQTLPQSILWFIAVVIITSVLTWLIHLRFKSIKL